VWQCVRGGGCICVGEGAGETVPAVGAGGCVNVRRREREHAWSHEDMYTKFGGIRRHVNNTCIHMHMYRFVGAWVDGCIRVCIYMYAYTCINLILR
jgi:hypothetical protein